MHPAISINTLSLVPDTLAAQIEFVARLGATAISPDITQLAENELRVAARQLRDAGLAIALLTHRSFGFARASETEQARERLAHSIESAAELGAPALLMTTGGRGCLDWNEAVDRFAQAIAPSVELAAAAGIRLAIEPTSHLYCDVSITHRLSDTTAIARRAGIGIIPDLFACWTDSHIEAAIAEAGPDILAVQVSDYVPGDRSLPCRAVPGDGAVQFDRLVPAITATGFRGFFDLEIIGERLQREGQEQGLARAARHIGDLLDQAPAPAKRADSVDD